MPVTRATRRAEQLDAHATSAGLSHGLAKLSAIVPQRGSRRGTGAVGGGRSRSCVHVIPRLSGQRQAAAGRVHRRRAGSTAHRSVFVEVADWRIAAGLDLPAAFEAAVMIEPMTRQRRGWNPALALRAAKTRKVVIGMGIVGTGIDEKPGPAQRNAPRLQRPEFSKSEVCKSEVCKPEV